MGVLWEVSYQISPKFRTKLASVAEVFSTLSTKCSAQHAQLIHLGRVESVFAQRIEQLMPILLLLSKHPFVVKTCHLAHRFSQTCLTSLSCLCGAAVAWVQAELTLTGHYRVYQSYSTRWGFTLALSHGVLGLLELILVAQMAGCISLYVIQLEHRKCSPASRWLMLNRKTS